MKKLNDLERLERGVQILLSAQDKADLEKMARASGKSLSGAARPLVLRALERWRKENPELAAMPLPEKPKTMMLGGKAVRTQRSLEAQQKMAATNGHAAVNGYVSSLNGTAPKSPAATRKPAAARGAKRKAKAGPR